ncbi:hypothetical protein V8G54_008002 [Vigna mungo]|uniref:Uncharacterized protein n=1 Tax=Vigna mungo TaxID=3915 RepID=A0AAQ3P4D3_VIGMU
MYGGVRGVVCGHEVTDSVVLEHFHGFFGVNGFELLGTVGAGIDEDAICAARMVFEEAGAIVDMAADYDPSRISVVVCSDLGDGICFGGCVHEWGGNTLLEGWVGLR